MYTHEVLKRWAAAGHRIEWFAASVDGRPNEEMLDGIRIIRGGGRHTVYRAARRHVEAQPPGTYDLLIDEVNTRPFLCHQWAIGQTPVVALIHQVAREVWFQEMPLPVAIAGRYLLEPWWLHQMRHVPTLTVSPSSRRSLLDYGVQKVVVVPEGIDGEAVALSNHKPAHLTLAFVGRLARNKRPDHALATHRLVRRHVPDAELVVVGGGVMLDELRRAGTPGVTFLGRVPSDLRNQIVSRAHGIVVTSVREGWALVVDEAAALGTPAFGYDVAGLSDSIPSANGVLVEPRPEALAEAIVSATPRLLAAERRPAWRGGAKSWDTVADEVFATALSIAESARPAVLATPAALARPAAPATSGVPVARRSGRSSAVYADQVA